MFADDESDSGEDYTSLHMFLAAHGLSEWLPRLKKEKIDLDALMLLSESDLANDLGMPLGHRKKLMKAIIDRNRDGDGIFGLPSFQRFLDLKNKRG